MNTNDLIINKELSKSFFIAKVFHRLPGFARISTLYNKKRHKYIEKQLQTLFDYSLSKTENIKSVKSKYSNKIWIFWWQGKKNMTRLSVKCYQSILKNKGKRTVILITKYNIRKYADIPEYIYQKIEKKEITLTHFSDILRFNLLNNYGGLWIDATIYTTGNLDKFDTHKLFTCSGYSNNTYFNISCGHWTGFFIGGPSHLKLFEFMDTFFELYWKYNDKLIDYFLIDYALNYAWIHDLSDFQFITHENQKLEPDLFKLAPLLNKKFDEKQFNNLTVNTEVFKLSNRHFLNRKTNTYFFSLK